MAVEPSSRVTGNRSPPSESELELELTGVESEEDESEGVISEVWEAAEEELAGLLTELLSSGVLEAEALATGTVTLPDGQPADSSQASQWWQKLQKGLCS